LVQRESSGQQADLVVNSAGTDPEDAAAALIRVSDDMVRIGGGAFRMGSDVHYPEERPAHDVTVDAFCIGSRRKGTIRN
jgi:sulfatase modifying factor 1